MCGVMDDRSDGGRRGGGGWLHVKKEGVTQ